ncbi:MAG: hypothetical protein U9Q69_01375, partial [Nanoarchaeota archaeon]|nr:hypothetical protein [Nanoarchaeota archaeon]
MKLTSELTEVFSPSWSKIFEATHKNFAEQSWRKNLEKFLQGISRLIRVKFPDDQREESAT